MRGSLQNSASILHRFKVLAMRIHTWLCCVEILYGVAILHVYALFWKTQFAKLSFRCFKTFDTSPALRGNLVLTTLLRNFNLRNLITLRIYKELCYVDSRFNINRLLVCDLFGRS